MNDETFRPQNVTKHQKSLLSNTPFMNAIYIYSNVSFHKRSLKLGEALEGRNYHGWTVFVNR